MRKIGLRAVNSVLTSSRGLSNSSSGMVAVLLSLAVAADAGDMMATAVPRARHGIGVFQGRVTHKRTGNLSAHHPEGTSPDAAVVEPLGTAAIIPASFR